MHAPFIQKTIPSAMEASLKGRFTGQESSPEDKAALFAYLKEQYPGVAAIAEYEAAAGEGQERLAWYFANKEHSEMELYLGSHVARESAGSAPGLILLKENNSGARAIETIRQLISTATGISESENAIAARRVAFYDLIYAEGPYARDLQENIAFFAPFHFTSLPPERLVNSRRRTILFTNIVAERFLALTSAPAADKILMHAATPFRPTAAELGEAIACWLYLHEFYHANGPLPLFGAEVKKLRLGTSYAFLEEFRVDASACLFLLKHAPMLPSAAGQAWKLIVLERIIRSARRNIRTVLKGEGVMMRSSDALHGALWLELLLRAQVLTRKGEKFRLDAERLESTLGLFLETIHDAESLAASLGAAEGLQYLLEFAEDTLRNFLVRKDEGRFDFTEPAIAWMQAFAAYPYELELTFGA